MRYTTTVDRWQKWCEQSGVEADGTKKAGATLLWRGHPG